jgi:hypothetical protein
VVNTAGVVDDGTHGLDPRPADNRTQHSDKLPPDLVIRKSTTVVTAEPGAVITYSLTYSNVAAAPALRAIITETVPAHSRSYYAGSGSGWSCADGSPAGTQCGYLLGNVAGGARGTLRFAVRLDSPLPLSEGVTSILNSVLITDTDSRRDAHPIDNSAQITTPLGTPTAVELASLAAGDVPTGIQVGWSTARELSISGFAIYRSLDGVRAHATLITLSPIPAHYRTGGQYAHLDDGATIGRRYFYWLVALGAGGPVIEYGPAAATRLGAMRVYLPQVTRP